MLSPKIWNTMTMSALTISIQHCTKGSIQARMGRGPKVEKKEIQGIQIGKTEAKLTQFTDDMILYKNPKGSTKILINEFSKVAGHKINIQNQFLSINLQ